jgi:hypothetical protein
MSAMVWWKHLFGRKPKSPIAGMLHRSKCILFSTDGQRSAEILEFANGEFYIRESELTEGSTFQDRHSGSVVGPFTSAKAAEQFIVATSWFKGMAA